MSWIVKYGLEFRAVFLNIPVVFPHRPPAVPGADVVLTNKPPGGTAAVDIVGVPNSTLLPNPDVAAGALIVLLLA